MDPSIVAVTLALSMTKERAAAPVTSLSPAIEDLASLAVVPLARTLTLPVFEVIDVVDAALTLAS